MPDRSRLDLIEQETRIKYSGSAYSKDTISHVASENSGDYFDILAAVRMNLVRQHVGQVKVLDLCCATGDHLFSFASQVLQGVGLDFSHPFVEKANETKNSAGFANVEFVEANARGLPFGDGYFNMIYCFSSLYYIPRVGEVINEIARVLRPGGACVLDMGNLYSLSRSYVMPILDWHSQSTFLLLK